HRIELRCDGDRTTTIASFTFTVTVVSVSLSPNHGRPGSSDGNVAATRVRIAGAGIACRGGDHNLVALWDGQTDVAHRSMTQPSAPFTRDSDVPGAPLPTAGRHTVALRCSADAKASNLAIEEFTIDPPDKPHLQVSPTTAHRNDTLTVTGSGIDCSTR